MMRQVLDTFENDKQTWTFFSTIFEKIAQRSNTVRI